MPVPFSSPACPLLFPCLSPSLPLPVPFPTPNCPLLFPCLSPSLLLPVLPYLPLSFPYLHTIVPFSSSTCLLPPPPPLSFPHLFPVYTQSPFILAVFIVDYRRKQKVRDPVLFSSPPYSKGPVMDDQAG